MKGVLLTMLLCMPAMQAQAGDMRWSRVPGLVAVALTALKQTTSGLADSITMHIEDDREDKSPTSPMPRPNTYETADHLLWIISDVNNDGRPDVFLAFDWSVTQGTSPRSAGVLMLNVGQHGPETSVIWRLACETYVFMPDDAASTLRILPGRGWRPFEFRGQGVRPTRYTWRRGADGQMECGAWSRPQPGARAALPSIGADRRGPAIR